MRMTNALTLALILNFISNCTQERSPIYAVSVGRASDTAQCFARIKMFAGGKCNRNDECGDVSQSALLHTHRRVNPGEKSDACQVCAKSFNRNYSLLTHEPLHPGENLHRWDRYAKGSSHILDLTPPCVDNTGEKFQKREICDQGFNQISQLQAYRRAHPRDKTDKRGVM